MHRSLSAGLAAGMFAVFAAHTASAQNFSYPNFNSTAGLTLNGTASASGGVLTVAPASASARGSVFRSAPVDVASGFETSFNFRITQVGQGADGMTFVIHNDPRGATALGGDGSTMGYGNQTAFAPIANSVVIEIDTYDAGTPWFDPDANHISVQTNGTGDNNAFHSLSIGWGSPVGIDLNDGLTHKITVSYTPGRLDVTLDGISPPLVSAVYDFTSGGTWSAGGTVGGLNLVGGAQAYVGFTAACGGLFQTHDVLDWSWTGGATTPLVYCTAGTSTNGCLPSLTASAQPSVSQATSCILNVANVEGQKSGLVFYGIDNTGFTPLPWHPSSTSFFCVKGPVQRTPAQSSGGALNQCNGQLSLDWNTFQAAFPGSLGTPFSVGDKAYAQAWYRDPPAPRTTNLSDAVELTHVP